MASLRKFKTLIVLSDIIYSLQDQERWMEQVPIHRTWEISVYNCNICSSHLFDKIGLALVLYHLWLRLAKGWQKPFNTTAILPRNKKIMVNKWFNLAIWSSYNQFLFGPILRKLNYHILRSKMGRHLKKFQFNLYTK